MITYTLETTEITLFVTALCSGRARLKTLVAKVSPRVSSVAFKK